MMIDLSKPALRRIPMFYRAARASGFGRFASLRLAVLWVMG